MASHGLKRRELLVSGIMGLDAPQEQQERVSRGFGAKEGEWVT